MAFSFTAPRRPGNYVVRFFPNPSGSATVSSEILRVPNRDALDFNLSLVEVSPGSMLSLSLISLAHGIDTRLTYVQS